MPQVSCRAAAPFCGLAIVQEAPSECLRFPSPIQWKHIVNGNETASLSEDLRSTNMEELALLLGKHESA
jgi:hypothetical protein